MRPRYLALVVVLLAVPVALALLVASEHRPGQGLTGAPATQVSLNLKAGSGNTALAGCGEPHHYTEYQASTQIRLDGSVTNPPRGGWKVKVKLKSCIAGRFESAGEIRVHLSRRRGRFRGEFRAPVPGLYFARAQVNVASRRIARSDKQFFRVR